MPKSTNKKKNPQVAEESNAQDLSFMILMEQRRIESLIYVLQNTQGHTLGVETANH